MFQCFPCLSDDEATFYFFKRFYLFERERLSRGEGQREADSPLSREPYMGLNPRTPGSRPELKADTSPTEPPRRPGEATFPNEEEMRVLENSH